MFRSQNYKLNVLHRELIKTEQRNWLRLTKRLHISKSTYLCVWFLVLGVAVGYYTTLSLELISHRFWDEERERVRKGLRSGEAFSARCTHVLEIEMEAPNENKPIQNASRKLGFRI